MEILSMYILMGCLNSLKEKDISTLIRYLDKNRMCQKTHV